MMGYVSSVPDELLNFDLLTMPEPGASSGDLEKRLRDVERALLIHLRDCAGAWKLVDAKLDESAVDRKEIKRQIGTITTYLLGGGGTLIIGLLIIVGFLAAHYALVPGHP